MSSTILPGLPDLYRAKTPEAARDILELPLESLPFPDLVQTSANSGGQWGPRDGAVLRFLGNDAYMMGGWAGGLYDSDWDDNPSATCNQVYKTSNKGATWTRIRNHNPAPDLVNGTHFAPGHWMNIIVAEGAMWYLNGDTGQPNNGPRNSDVRRSVNGIDWVKQNVGNAPYHNYFFTIPGYLNGTFYIFGGHTDFNAASATNAGWKSTDGGVNWTATPAAPWTARGNVEQLVNHQGKLWLIGGGRHDSVEGNRVYYNDVWSFDGTTWTQELANGHSQWAGVLWANVFEFDGWLYISRGWNGTVNTSTSYRSRDGKVWELVDWSLQGSHADSAAPGPDGILFAAGNWQLGGTPVNTTSPSYFATGTTDPIMGVQRYVTDKVDASIIDQYVWNPSGTILDLRVGGEAGTLASRVNFGNYLVSSNGQMIGGYDGSYYLCAGLISDTATIYLGSGENQVRLRSQVYFKGTATEGLALGTGLVDRTTIAANGTMFHTAGNAFVSSFSSSASVVYARYNNLDTAGVMYFCLGENATDGSTPFWLGRNGSTHPSRPYACEIINGHNSDLTLGTNAQNMLRMVSTGRVDALYEMRLPTLADASADNDSWYYSSTQSAPAYKTAAGVVYKLNGDALTTNPLSQFAATTSAQLAGVISDETGSGALVFATSPTLVTPNLGAATATSINNVAILDPGGAGTLRLDAHQFRTIGSGFNITLSATALTSLTLPTTGTLATLAGTETLSNKTIASPILTGDTIIGSGVTLRENAGDLEIRATGGALINQVWIGNFLMDLNGQCLAGSDGSGYYLCSGFISDSKTIYIGGNNNAVHMFYRLGVGGTPTMPLEVFGAGKMDSLELGHANDTTFTRVRAGVSAVEGKVIGRQNKVISIRNPTGSEDVTMFRADEGWTITKMVAVLIGSSTPSVTWTVRKGSDRSAAGTEVVTSGTTTTSTTTGSVVTSLNSATIAANDFVWLETTAQSGTVNELHVTVFMEPT